MRPLWAFLLTASTGLLPYAAAAQKPHTLDEIQDPGTRSWWQATTDLANDSMHGRDTGSADYQRAAEYVAARFQSLGLKPAGDNGTYYQSVPMHSLQVRTADSAVTLHPMSGKSRSVTPLRLLQDITLTPQAGMPTQIEAPLVFVGYGSQAEITASGLSLRGACAVLFSGVPSGVTGGAQLDFQAARTRALAAAGSACTVAIDNPGSLEPPRWPAAYAKTVTNKGTLHPAGAPVSLRLNPEAAPRLFASAPFTWKQVLAQASKGSPLPAFALGQDLHIQLALDEADVSSPNILAVLPGSDDKLQGEYIAVSAHLDGYGLGAPVAGDGLYNGALDDAAYVATLLELATTDRPQAPRRSLLICVFTGEEKGLLGSNWFARHLTVPQQAIKADINLDQLRPLFPLRALTMLAVNKSTLGDMAKSVAAQRHIEIREDQEPERGLIRRSDHAPFLALGIPATGFIFAYNPGSPEEKKYREWYAHRYHKPQDDLTQPIDFAAARDFNDFFIALTNTAANADNPPVMKE